MTRKMLLIVLGILILFACGSAATWMLLRTPEEITKLPETPEAQANRISAALLRANLAEIRNSSLFLEFQMEGEELLKELDTAL